MRESSPSADRPIAPAAPSPPPFGQRRRIGDMLGIAQRPPVDILALDNRIEHIDRVEAEQAEPLHDQQQVSPAIAAAFFAHRADLIRFFASRGRAAMAEDLLHELWLALPLADNHIEAPLSYMYRMANSLIIKQYNRETQDMKRDRAWSDMLDPTASGRSEQPSADRAIAARQTAAAVLAALAGEGERVFRIFHRHRIQGLTQSEVAAEMRVSIGTVERDLRRARAVLARLRDHAFDSLL